MVTKIERMGVATHCPGRLRAVFMVWFSVLLGAIPAVADNILIADQFNNRVIEADPAGDIVWQFGLGPNDFSPKSIIGCNDAQRVGQLTLMAGTGTPAGVIPQATNGAPDNRVLLVNQKGDIVWQYGQFGQTGSDSNLLNTPVQCTWLPNSHVLITDQGNARIIEVTLSNQIVWQYPGPNTNAADQLNNPNSAELLENGNILIADENNNRAIEVTRAHQIVKTFTAGGTAGFLAFASRLENNVVWQYVINTNPPGVLAPLPTRAVRLANGDTLISDQFNNRIIRVAPAGQIVASYGLPLAGGTGIGNNVGYDVHTTQKGLYAPYDAKIIGDYTGLTPPFEIVGISVAANKLTLTWIGGTGPFLIQSKARLSDNTWVNAMVVTNRTATLSITNTVGFYRVSDEGSP